MADFGKLNFSVSFNRTSAFPLEANSYFNNYTEAEQAAQTAVEPGSAESTYYIGQTLTVADETDCNLYIINPDQSLKQLTMLDIPDITWENILNKPTTIAGYGITDAYTKTESNDRYLKLTGGNLTGNINIYTILKPEIGFGIDESILGMVGFNSSEGIFLYHNTTGSYLRLGIDGLPYYNDYKIWHEGNDGSGSGLDADLLDGKHYSQFLYSFAHDLNKDDDVRSIPEWTYFSGHNMINSPTITWFSGITLAANYNSNYKVILGSNEYGEFFVSGNNNGVWYDWKTVAYTSSNVASATKLQTPRLIWGQSFDGTNNISGDMNDVGTINGCVHLSSNGNVGIGTEQPSQKLHVAGNVLATGFYEESDIQLKTNIQPIDFTNNIELVSFNWKKDGSKSYGVIAQQVEQYYPELVSTDESTGYKSVNYDAVLIIKCAQLENRIKQLEKELEDLKNE